jgi:four helix bundle protein
MPGITRFEEILAWQKARELVREVYVVCGVLPFSRDFGLKDQICRAAVSAMNNVAEGFGRKSSRDFAHFLDVARGSALEVQSLLYVALDLKYIQPAAFAKLYKIAEETISLIAGFTSYLRKQSPR